MNIAVLLSGGVDSSVVVHLLANKVTVLLYFISK